eukprot:1160751-Pelagomonas_calceolata.AAC.9
MIDLTEEDDAGRQSIGGGGAAEGDARKKTLEAAQTRQSEDEAQRQAIMAFARSKLNSGGSSNQGEGHPAFAAPADGDKSDAHADSNKRARQEEQPVNPLLKQQSTLEQPKQCPAQLKNSMNDTLYMLRLERENRQRQRQRKEAQETGYQQPSEAEQLQHQPQGGGQANGSVQHKRKREEQNPCASTSSHSPPSTTATILSYNVW